MIPLVRPEKLGEPQLGHGSLSMRCAGPPRQCCILSQRLPIVTFSVRGSIWGCCGWNWMYVCCPGVLVVVYETAAFVVLEYERGTATGGCCCRCPAPGGWRPNLRWYQDAESLTARPPG